MSSKNVDRLSMLPEEILSQILSLMPTKMAIRTSILSKRWRYSWMSVTNLDFGDINTIPSLDSLTRTVDRVLMFCKPSQVELFRLHFPVICARKSNVSIWIDKAVRLNVRELDLRVHQLQLPLSMFICKTLTKLVLDYSGYDYLNLWEFQCPVNLPCLKTLDMTVFANPFVNAFKLISGCPVLENISLDVRCCNYEGDYIFNIPTLKRLILKWFKRPPLTHKVVLRVPNLEYLFAFRMRGFLYVMEDLPSLVEASVSVLSAEAVDLLRVEFLKGMCGVKSLSLEHFLSTSPLPIFLNMKHLELKSFEDYELLTQFLESCPQLTHLCIEKTEESGWIEPKLVPACMLTNLATIKFLNCKGLKCDIQFLEYMLVHAEVLKTVTITRENLREEEETRLCARLLEIQRASRCCEIHFLGNRGYWAK